MSPLQTHASTQAVLPIAPDARASLVAAVAKAIAKADAHRHYGCYDYSSYPGDAPPHVIRDEDAGREVWRSGDEKATDAEYRRLTEEWVALKALEAIHDWRLEHDAR